MAAGYMEFFSSQLEQAIFKTLFGIDGNENSIIEEKHLMKSSARNTFTVPLPPFTKHYYCKVKRAHLQLYFC